MATSPGLAHVLATPENRSALIALRDLLHAMLAGQPEQVPNPIYLHGPSGTGKTYLVQALVQELTAAGFSTCQQSGNDFSEKVDLEHASEADLLVIEDVQHLPSRCVPTVLGVFDERLRNTLPMIFTATQGPARVEHRGEKLPRRFASRLACGLVIALEPMHRATRRRLLETLAQAAKLPPNAEILDWLAEHLVGGGRQLEGAIQQWQCLQRLHKKPLQLADLRSHFLPQVDAIAPTLKRITTQVCASFHVDIKHVVSARRSRETVLPRQISMYLARQLTNLSLVEIGKHFGGRDHKTVQYACARVEAAIKKDAVLSGTVRQLQGELQ